MRVRTMAWLGGMAALALGTPPAHALEVDLELVLAVDVSASVDEDEALLQRDGYVRALVDPRVVQAIENGPLGRIALTYVEWGGHLHQVTVVGWTVIDGAASARAFAETLARAPISAEVWTSISTAIDYSARLFDDNGLEGARRVIDVSGDGTNNRGRPEVEARDAAVAKGITINGLPIVNQRPNLGGGQPPKDLDKYYEAKVIGGPGAFMEVAEGFESFGEAILKKLIREIALAP